MELDQCLDAAPSPRKGPDPTHRPNREVRDPAQNPGRDRPEGPAAISLAHRGTRPRRNRDCSRRAEEPRQTSTIGSRKCWRMPAWARAAAAKQLILQGRVSDQRRGHPPARHPGRPRHVLGSPSTASRSSSSRWSITPSTSPRATFRPTPTRPGRPRVVDLLPEIPERVYTVGRLDEASTGLLILTNDGDLANRLAHPRYGVEKLYRALVAGLPTPEMLAKLTEGVWLSDGKVRAKRARIVGRQGQATMLELVLAEGKKREIRRMLSKLGHKVMSLNRIAVGPDRSQRALRRRMPFALEARNRATPQSGLGRLGGAASILRRPAHRAGLTVNRGGRADQSSLVPARNNDHSAAHRHACRT